MDITAYLQQLIQIVVGFVTAVVALIGSLQLAPVPTPAPVPTDEQVATATPSETSNFPTATTTTAKPTAKPVPTPAAETPVAKPAATTQPKPAQALSAETLNTVARSSIVNILCTTLVGGAFKPISGSGVMIDGRGVVLTNAHVAQFFLLRDYVRPGNIDCVVRTGSPAINTYRAELLYLPMAWINDNASQITSSEATGTGENDFAFLRVTGPYNPSNSLPSSIPHLAMSSASVDVGDSMLLAAYPAGFLSGELITTQLYASSAFAYVTQLFTFDDNNFVDLFSVGGSIASQSGSSGGAVVRADGSLAGIISTATLKGATNQRDLRAISIGYIDRALTAQGKGGVIGLLSGDIAAKAAHFNATTAPKETAKLEAVLNAAN